MKKYEIMTITKLDQGEAGARELSNTIKDTISSLNGKVLNSDFWGKRKFAYEINHDQEGFYDLIEFEFEPTKLNELQEKLNLTTGLVRYLISALD